MFEVAGTRLVLCRLFCVSSRSTVFLPFVKLRFLKSKHIDGCPRSEACVVCQQLRVIISASGIVDGMGNVTHDVHDVQ